MNIDLVHQNNCRTINPTPMRRLLLFTSLMLFSVSSFATHLLGGEITWRCHPTNGNYIFTLRLYKECGTPAVGLGPNQTIQGPSGAIPVTQLPGNSGLEEISPTCNSNTPADITSCATSVSGIGAVQVFTYEGTTSLAGTPPAGGWIFSWTSCCRPGTVENTNSGGYFVRAIMFPFSPAGSNATPATVNVCYDNAPDFQERGSLTMCKSGPFTYNHLAADRDLDSVFFRFADPWQSANTPVVWNAGFSTTAPYPNSNSNAANGPITITPQGEISMNVTTATTGSYASCFAIESWRCGDIAPGVLGYQKIAEVYRDVAIVFRDCPGVNNEPAVSIDTSIYTFFTQVGQTYTTRVYPGDTIAFQLSATDFDFNPGTGAFQTIGFDAAGLQVGNPLSSSTGCLGVTPCAQLTPAQGQTGYAQALNNDIDFFWVPNCQHLNFGNVGCGGLNTFFFSLRMQDDFCPAPEIVLSTIVIEVVPGDPNAPPMKCLFYDVATDDIRIGWDKPERDSSLEFNYYVVWGAPTLAGPFTQVDTVFDLNTLSTDIPFAAGYRHFYMQQSTGNCDFLSQVTDTFSLMINNLTAWPPNVSSDSAYMSWTAIGSNNTLPPTSSGVYEIWTEIPTGSGNWNKVDESTQLDFGHPVTVCDKDASYQIRITDTATGCQSGSTVMSANFNDQTNNDQMTFDSVTVGLNGKALLSWQSSPSPDVVAYYLMFNDPKSGWGIVDTIPEGTPMPYEWDDSQADTRSETFKLLSVDSCDNRSDEQATLSYTTIYLKNFLDKCDGFSRNSWNYYRRFVGGIGGYNLLVRITPPGGTQGPWIPLFTGTDADTVFRQDFLVNGSNYCYKVQAYDTAQTVTASSNVVCIDANVPQKSRVLYLAQVTNNFLRSAIDLKMFIDVQADAKTFTIERATSLYGPYRAIGRVQKPTINSFIDYRDFGVDPGRLQYYYRVTATDVCGGRDTTSNTGNNIILNAVSNANLTNTIFWNHYKGFGGDVREYQIYRSLESNPENFELLPVTIAGTDSTYTDNIRQFAQTEKSYNYYVVAVEGNNPLAFTDNGAPFTSTSNMRTVTQKARVFIPTAFRPSSEIPANRTFGPSMRLDDVQNYNFYIMNRWGTVVFQTNDPTKQWDGDFKGSEAPTGVYIYNVRYSTLNDQPIEERGSFTLIR